MLGGVKLGVESFDAMYFDECFQVPENIENRPPDKSVMEYQHGLPVKELHSDDDKLQISEFIVSAKIECELSEQKVGSHLIDAQRQNKWTTWSSPAYFGCNILKKTLASLSPNTYSNWHVKLQVHSCSFAGFIVYITFSNLQFDPGIHDIPIAFSINMNMFTINTILSIYDPTTTLDEWVYIDGKSASCSALILAMVRTQGYFGRLLL
ncbi:hypothetical protein A4A49_13294 [Nicotiana attenuata]|uniref:Uncharacterized protein n=1 Tax=Nicotiana attenuata TaxID=49451 RepID=A0A1J6IFE6_NICAT|nr:hypothetical protein A4A49_13294 [Nicotiana attenuata]